MDLNDPQHESRLAYNPYWERGFVKYFGLNIKAFYHTIGDTVRYFNVDKFRAFIYRNAGMVEGNCEFSGDPKHKQWTLDFLVEQKYGRNASKFLNNLLAEDLPF
jgi:hypothetical protein